MITNRVIAIDALQGKDGHGEGNGKWCREHPDLRVDVAPATLPHNPPNIRGTVIQPSFTSRNRPVAPTRALRREEAGESQ